MRALQATLPTLPVVPGRLVERYDYDPYGTPYVETWDLGT